MERWRRIQGVKNEKGVKEVRKMGSRYLEIGTDGIEEVQGRGRVGDGGLKAVKGNG